MTGPLSATQRRLAADLAARGRPFAAFAATVLVCRGRLLLDPLAFARLLGVPVDHLHRLESGWRPPEHAPRRLASLAPDLAWADVGIDLAEGADRARRHPSTGRIGRIGPSGREDPPP